MNAIIYFRGNDTIEQVKHCIEYAERKGYDIKDATDDWTAVEVGVMASKTDAIITVGKSRITRDMKEMKSVETILNVYGTKVLVAEGYYKEQ